MNSREKLEHLNEVISLLYFSKSLLCASKDGFEGDQAKGFQSAIEVLEGSRNHTDYNDGAKEIFSEIVGGLE